MDLAPDELLTHLDDLVLRMDREEAIGRDGHPDHPSGEVGATCLYAVYDPVSGGCAMARAGHPPPVLAAPDGTVRFLELPAGPPLGLGGMPFEAAEFHVAENSVLALYTDGLIESQVRDLDDACELLRSGLAEPGRPLEETCDRIPHDLLPQPQTDDVALLLTRTRTLGTSQVAPWELPAEPSVALIFIRGDVQ
ncbi:PP2C family protein-serine/threonine phosphatase [Streptomyces yaanensis]|uniref:PP2C family protein-serine/threonine phosphatase n=1 Tax=Streptomyces yaanensis TaxID=1142239 RepID=A0ABV7SA24_9ACTN|nr:PP2C family protein-serine/threonine phosphatase [Streptomyces sp. CGMCC 4.7035]WNB96729.1 PP2C family protein-serine/threonine phosphatase [Streptomyces sp. CGMCC 4.7035]